MIRSRRKTHQPQSPVHFLRSDTVFCEKSLGNRRSGGGTALDCFIICFRPSLPLANLLIDRLLLALCIGICMSFVRIVQTMVFNSKHCSRKNENSPDVGEEYRPSRSRRCRSRGWKRPPRVTSRGRSLGSFRRDPPRILFLSTFPRFPASPSEWYIERAPADVTPHDRAVGMSFLLMLPAFRNISERRKRPSRRVWLVRNWPL